MKNLKIVQILRGDNMIKTMFRGFVTCGLLLCVLWFSGCSSAASNNESISLTEAVSIADDYLKESGLSASKETLTHVVSQDFSDTAPEEGTDGKRICWNLSFASTSDQVEGYSIQVLNGKVTECDEAAPVAGRYIDLSSCTLDSGDALEIAEEYGLKPGTEGPVGFAFMLETENRGTDLQPDTYPALTILGQNEESTYAAVVVDLSIGQRVNAYYRIEEEDGDRITTEWVVDDNTPLYTDGIGEDDSYIIDDSGDYSEAYKEEYQKTHRFDHPVKTKDGFIHFW